MNFDRMESSPIASQLVPTPKESVEHHGREMTTGALFMFVFQLLALPVSVVISAFLARRLGPVDYGVYAVAASIVAWLEVSITSLFGRSSIRFIANAGRSNESGESLDWQSITSTVVGLQFLFGVALALVIYLTAPLVALVLNTPDLIFPLQLFSLAPPIFAAGKGYASALIGRRAYRRSSLFPAIHSLTRLAIVIVLVGSGWGISGAVLGTIGGLAAELIFARIFIHPPIISRAGFPMRQFILFSLPLALDSFSRRLSNGIDLWVVQAIGGSRAAGFYGAADNFSISSSLLGTSLASPLLATVTYLWKNEQIDDALVIIHQVLRLSFCILPIAALGAGAATEIVTLIYGDTYLPAAPILAWLCFAAFASLIANLTTAILAAIGRPGTTFAITGPLLLPSLILSLYLVPRVGGIGAAATAVLVGWLSVFGTLWALQHSRVKGPGRKTFLRVSLVSIVSFFLANTWHVPGAWVILQLLALSGVAFLLLWATGEITLKDLSFAVSLFRRANPILVSGT
jgi:O-antigen/teichoic acid export membrane protein